ncbi:regulator of G-protein signaling 1 [Notechis scutatus]|uniref:Regulator of G-protein signaling 1 n=1 Tax=Notechis scutatus TaxID=8663 RepID=A0A6J1U2B9_9SAUR|nr:regulator of G-protein signaling 1 [Notechis scutatus]
MLGLQKHCKPKEREPKMPWLFMWHTASTEIKTCEIAGSKDHQKKTKALGVEVKKCFMGLVPPIESAHMKYSSSRDVTLSTKEVIQWSQSLEKLLATHRGQEAFREFLKSEFSDENIEFWLACEDYRKTQADCLHSKAEKIYQEFVKLDAKKQVNIDFHIRKSVAKKVQDPTPSSFDEVQRLIYVLMERDSYPRFLKSQHYHNLLNKVQSNRLK